MFGPICVIGPDVLSTQLPSPLVCGSIPPPVAYQPVVVPDPPGHRTLPSSEFPPVWSVSTALTFLTLRDSCVRSVLCSAFRCEFTPDQVVAEDGQVTAACAVTAPIDMATSAAATNPM